MDGHSDIGPGHEDQHVLCGAAVRRKRRLLAGRRAEADAGAIVGGLKRIAAPARLTLGHLGQRQEHPNTGVIVLSGGHSDGSILADWTVTAARTKPGWMCRSPDGCTAARLGERSYCASHLAKYTVPAARQPRKTLTRKRQSPRLLDEQP